MDEMFTEKTIAADPYTDPVDQEPVQGAANPYEQGQQPAEPYEQTYQQPQYQQPQYQQPQYQQPQYQQPQYQQPQYQQPQYQQPQYQQPQYQQPLYQQPLYQPQQYPAYRQPVQGGGAAKAFAIVSFVAGCIALGILMVIVMATTSTSSNPYRYSSARAGMAAVSLIYGMITSVPGLIFGIIAMAKKTNKFPLALLGIIFSASLLVFGCVMLMTL